MKSGNTLTTMSTAAMICGAMALCGSGLSSFAAEQPASPAVPPAEDSCAKLASLKLDQVEIVSAKTQPAGAPVEGARLPGSAGNPAGPVAGLPAFCRVIGSIHPEPGSDIRFEVWMPSQGWDGRFNGGNNGGYAGSIDYRDLGLAVRAGQAGASTDTGHAAGGTDAAWAKGHPERVRDYGWRAIHLTAVVGKQLVASFYGRGADHSYFIGCSNGGRQALMEASRFPEDYDGIVAGAPAALATDVAVDMANTVQAQQPPGAAIHPEQMSLLQSEELRQCGAIDGLIDDPRQCKIDVSKLACGVSSSPQCFTKPQLAALEKIHAGVFDKSGRRVAWGYLPSGAEVGAPSPTSGWAGWILEGQQTPPLHKIFSTGMFESIVPTPFATPETFNFDKDPAPFKAAVAADLDAKPDMARFFARGGKLIIWHGWADAAIPPQGTLAFYQASLRNSGATAKDSMRLFLVPGVQHCFGGPGPDVFGQIGAPQPGDTPDRGLGAAVQAWVETGRAPETLVGRLGFGGIMGIPATGPEKQRLICAYPARAVPQPGADPDKASSYSCHTAKDATKTKSAG